MSSLTKIPVGPYPGTDFHHPLHVGGGLSGTMQPSLAPVGGDAPVYPQPEPRYSEAAISDVCEIERAVLEIRRLLNSLRLTSNGEAECRIGRTTQEGRNMGKQLNHVIVDLVAGLNAVDEETASFLEVEL